MFTRAAIVSLLVLISNPPAGASEAASGCVVRPLHVTVTAPARAAPDKVIVIALVENPDVHPTAGDTKTPHAFVTEAVMRLDGKVSVMVSPDTKAVDVVNVTVAKAVADATAVVMLSAVAAADTQPTHGQDMYVATESTDV